MVHGCCMVVVLLLYGCCMVVLWLLYGCCMVVVWLFYGCCMVVLWLLYGCCMIVLWLLYGCCMVVVWLFWGYCMGDVGILSTWRGRGGCSSKYIWDKNILTNVDLSFIQYLFIKGSHGTGYYQVQDWYCCKLNLITEWLQLQGW